jgi:integrase
VGSTPTAGTSHATHRVHPQVLFRLSVAAARFKGVKTSARQTSPRRPRGTGSVYRRSDGYWVGETTVAGKRRRVTAKTRGQAEARLDDLVKHSAGIAFEDGKMASWLRRWVKDAPAIKPVTRFGYRSIVENHLIPHLGKLRLTDVKRGHVLAMLSALNQKGLSPTTQRNVRNCLSAALMEAIEQEYIDTNPARVKVEDPRYRTNVDGSKRRIVAILKALEDHRYGDLYRFLIYTGMRIGEAVALDWSDIDKDRHTITVRRSLTREPLADDPRRTRKVIGPTKTGRERVIPVSAELMGVIFRRLDRLGYKRRGVGDQARPGSGLVFPSATEPSKPLDPSHALHAFQETLSRAGIYAREGKPVRLHECRHLYATYLLSSGKDVATVSRLLGHSTPTTTMRFYAGVVREAEIEAGAAVRFFEPTRQEIASARAVQAKRERDRARSLDLEGIPPPLPRRRRTPLTTVAG